MYQRGIKRLLDVLLSLGGLIVLAQVFLLFAAWIKLDSPAMSLS